MSHTDICRKLLAWPGWALGSRLVPVTDRFRELAWVHGWCRPAFESSILVSNLVNSLIGFSGTHYSFGASHCWSWSVIALLNAQLRERQEWKETRCADKKWRTLEAKKTEWCLVFKVLEGEDLECNDWFLSSLQVASCIAGYLKTNQQQGRSLPKREKINLGFADSRFIDSPQMPQKESTALECHTANNSGDGPCICFSCSYCQNCF